MCIGFEVIKRIAYTYHGHSGYSTEGGFRFVWYRGRQLNRGTGVFAMQFSVQQYVFECSAKSHSDVL